MFVPASRQMVLELQRCDATRSVCGSARGVTSKLCVRACDSANWLPEGYSHRCKLYSDLNPMSAAAWNRGGETAEESKVWHAASWRNSCVMVTRVRCVLSRFLRRPR